VITDLQAKIIYTIYRECGIQPGETFLPGDVFPGADADSRHLRIMLTAMAWGKLLDTPAPEDGEAFLTLPASFPFVPIRFRLALSQQALQEYDLWAQRAGLARTARPA
jgi:hypothetical protein